MEFSSAQAMNQSFFKQVMIQDRRDPRSSAQGFNTGGSFDLEVNPSNTFPYPKVSFALMWDNVPIVELCILSDVSTFEQPLLNR